MAFETEDDLISELGIGLIILTLISSEWVSIRCYRAGKNASISTGITLRSSGKVNFSLYKHIPSNLDHYRQKYPEQSGPLQINVSWTIWTTRDKRIPDNLERYGQKDPRKIGLLKKNISKTFWITTDKRISDNLDH
ncbi:hypothetical protein PoB_002271400 [Plakobranchus ocellatus]|uniref:Uncharacterized protein n=1 Tax=Plakobranchus ocellatus TaxID=259542 RepID=A0AAV3ZLL3_9GAST|nr:hypothetical protein PoB_002271400 [Plakobranchus ocellatus]